MPISADQPRRGGRPSRDAAAELPLRILACARELFLDQGFVATSLQQIAERAGATKRTLYVKVGDKEALFRAVVEDVLHDWRQSANISGVEGDLRVRLEHIGLQLLTATLSPDILRLNRVLLSEAYRFPSLIQLVVEQIQQGPLPRMAHLLMEARGEVGTPCQDDQIAARFLYEMVVGAPLRVALTGRQASIDMSFQEWVHRAVAVFLMGWRGTVGQAQAGQLG